MAIQLLVAPYATQLVDVPVGSRIAISTYGESKASVDIADSVSPTVGSRNFVALSVISNNEIVYGTYTTPKTFQIVAGGEPVYYSVGVSPIAITSQRRVLNSHRFVNDFDTIVTATDYTITNASAGTVTLPDGDNGLLLLTNAAANGNFIAIQKKGSSYRFEVGKELWFSARFAVSDVNLSTFLIGLQNTDATPDDVTDGVFFLKSSGSLNVNLFVEKTNVNTQTLVTNALVNATFVTLSFFYNGINRIDAYVNGVFAASSVTTNLPNTVDTTVSWAVYNGEAVAKTMTLDYIEVEKAR
jgi:hypothetical protein